MKVTVITQPEPLLTAADDIVKQGLSLDGNDRDEIVNAYLLAAQAELDGPLGWIGISVAPQSVEARVDDFSCPIKLLGCPIIGDCDINYLATTGTETALDPATHVLLSDGTVQLAAGKSWPALYKQGEAVRITYDVGIDDDADPRIKLMQTLIVMHAKMSLDFDEPEQRRTALERLARPIWSPVL